VPIYFLPWPRLCLATGGQIRHPRLFWIFWINCYPRQKSDVWPFWPPWLAQNSSYFIKSGKEQRTLRWRWNLSPYLYIYFHSLHPLRWTNALHFSIHSKLSFQTESFNHFWIQQVTKTFSKQRWKFSSNFLVSINFSLRLLFDSFSVLKSLQ